MTKKLYYKNASVEEIVEYWKDQQWPTVRAMVFKALSFKAKINLFALVRRLS